MQVRSARTLEPESTPYKGRHGKKSGSAAQVLAVAAFVLLGLLASPGRALAESPAATVPPSAERPSTAVSVPLPENSLCLDCHQDRNQVMTKGEIQVSLYVSPEDYNSSSHKVVSCVACHEEVLKQTEEQHKSSAGTILTGHALRLQMSERCGKCHAGAVLATYRESFHWAELDLGGRKTAACGDCHAAHSVLPADDPRSSVAAANLPATCGQQGCHPGATPAFTAGVVHSSPMRQGPWSPVRIIWKAFIILILFDTLKDGPIILFELVRRIRRRPAVPSLTAAEVGSHVSD